MSSRVMVKYCMAPTILLYLEESTSRSPSRRDRVVQVAEGVLIGIAVWSWNLWSKSWTYFCCSRKML